MQTKVEFYRHGIDATDRAEVEQVLHSIFLTTGPVTARFESQFAEYLGQSHAIGVTSCTAALFLALKALGIGPGMDVITTPMTFIATSNSILHVGATPVFVDVDPCTANINPELVEAAITPRTRAIIPVHLYGQMADMETLHDIAKRHNLFLIEDAAHSVEATKNGHKPGQLANAACFSFYATKNLTCGEGGAITTNDDELAELIKKLRLHGMSKDAASRYTSKYQHWDMEVLGYKANLNDILAALLINQLPRLEQNRTRREAICQMYEAAFSTMEGVDFPRVLPDACSSRHLFTIWVDPERRDSILSRLQEQGVGVAVNYRAVHLLRYYRSTFGFKPGDFPETERIGASTITLPLYPSLTDDQVASVINAVSEAVQS